MVTSSDTHPPGKTCCTPARISTQPTGIPVRVFGNSRIRTVSHSSDVLISAGTFQMGDAFDEGYPADGETPVHQVRIDAFTIDATTVTNRMFAEFISATGYQTDAQKYGSSAVFHLLVRAPQISGASDEKVGVSAHGVRNSGPENRA